ncbi:alpha/beta-hydrolase, partial [Aureobasidium melanogenum]
MAIATRLSPKAMTTLGVMAFVTLCFQTFNSSALSPIDATILARLDVIERQMATLRATMNHVLNETNTEIPANIPWPDQPSSDEGLEAAVRIVFFVAAVMAWGASVSIFFNEAGAKAERAFAVALPLVPALIVSRPNGTYSVGTQITEFVDDSRFVNGTHRRIMTTSFFPTGYHSDCLPYLIPYMPKLTADYDAVTWSQLLGTTIPNATLEQLQLQVCNSTCGDRRFRDRAWPLTLFSPGLGASRQLYNALAEQLAAKGYIVVTIDTPLQASIVEYTDGSFVLGTDLITNPQPEVALPDRVKDIILVKNKVLTGVGVPSSVKPDASRIAAWGHSFGGAAAAQVSFEDPSFKAGINFDGTLFGSVVTSGLKQPFLIFSHAGELLNETINSWNSFLQASPKFDKLELSLNGSVHNTFSDAPLLADLAGLDELPGVGAALGTLNGRRVLVILAAYTDAFFKFAFHGATKVPELLKGPSARFPEVDFVVDLP